MRSQGVEKEGQGDDHQQNRGRELAEEAGAELGWFEMTRRHEGDQRDGDIPGDGQDGHPGGDADHQVIDGHGQQHEGRGHQELVRGWIQHRPHDGFLIEPPGDISIQQIREPCQGEDHAGLDVVPVPDRDGEDRNREDPEQGENVRKSQIHGARSVSEEGLGNRFILKQPANDLVI